MVSTEIHGMFTDPVIDIWQEAHQFIHETRFRPWFLKSAFYTLSGSRFLGTELPDSDYDFVVVGIPDPQAVLKKWTTMTPLVSQFTFRARTIQEIATSIDQTDFYLRDGNIVSEVLASGRAIDCYFCPVLEIADQLAGRELFEVRAQMLILSLLEGTARPLLPISEEVWQAFLNRFRDLVRNSEIHLQITVFWDRWWRFMAHPTGGFDSGESSSVDDSDFALRTEAMQMGMTSVADVSTGYDNKRGSLLVAITSRWLRFYGVKTDIEVKEDLDFARRMREGGVSYRDFAAKRNLLLEGIRFLQQRMRNGPAPMQLAIEFLREVEALAK